MKWELSHLVRNPLPNFWPLMAIIISVSRHLQNKISSHITKEVFSSSGHGEASALKNKLYTGARAQYLFPNEPALL